MYSSIFSFSLIFSWILLNYHSYLFYHIIFLCCFILFYHYCILSIAVVILFLFFIIRFLLFLFSHSKRNGLVNICQNCIILFIFIIVVTINYFYFYCYYYYHFFSSKIFGADIQGQRSTFPFFFPGEFFMEISFKVLSQGVRPRLF